MTAVWEDRYYHQGNKSVLLVALALADSARSEDGKAWPGVEYLSRKARTSTRGVQEACRQLETDGKIVVIIGAGPHGTNVYQFTTAQQLNLPVKEAHTPAMAAPAIIASSSPTPVKAPEEPAAGCIQSVINRQEPEETKPAEGRAKPDEIWQALVAIKRFNLKPEARARQSGEVQHMIGTAHATRGELETLLRFYNTISLESRHPEAKTRKLTPRSLLENLAEQIALAEKVCPPKKTAVARPPAPPPASEKGNADRTETAPRFEYRPGDFKKAMAGLTDALPTRVPGEGRNVALRRERAAERGLSLEQYDAELLRVKNELAARKPDVDAEAGASHTAAATTAAPTTDK